VTSTMVRTTRGVQWRVRCDENAGDLSDLFSAALSLSETAGRCAIRCDEYNSGWHDGDAENDDM